MTVVLKRGEKASSVKRKMNSLRKKNGFDAYKHCGVLKITEDPMKIQKKLRDEWR